MIYHNYWDIILFSVNLFPMILKGNIHSIFHTVTLPFCYMHRSDLLGHSFEIVIYRSKATHSWTPNSSYSITFIPSIKQLKNFVKYFATLYVYHTFCPLGFFRCKMFFCVGYFCVGCICVGCFICRTCCLMDLLFCRTYCIVSMWQM